MQLSDAMKDLKHTIKDAQSAGVSRGTLANVVELATLRTHSLLETFLQELFYLSLLHDPTIPGNGPTLAVKTRDEADLLVLSSGGRREKFLSWLPLARTLELADAYLKEGSVFDRLRFRSIEQRAASELVTVRNAIAHPSDHARLEFEKLAQAKSYPFGRAADYLLSTRGGVQEVLLMMTQAEVMAGGLVAKDELIAATLLEPEAPFPADKKAPPGTYECARCSEKRILTVKRALGACPSCEPLTPCPHCSRVPAATSKWTRVTQSV
ncbi:hypothetical protein RS83_00151 [Microbacterium oxydans]|uniref:Uncharacterized protein n=2 Tax=Microbacterium oxydans TaxID=82380 RepID=A0A0F0LIX6_9MICO|nr:hypothetical protein RS83_00151 [Microbacterium oxydans]